MSLLLGEYRNGSSVTLAILVADLLGKDPFKGSIISLKGEPSSRQRPTGRQSLGAAGSERAIRGPASEHKGSLIVFPSLTSEPTFVRLRP